MPIYEFYCPPCHKIFSFRSLTVDTEKRPPCPACGGDNLERKISRFAVLSSDLKGQESDDETGDLPVDERRLERAMETLGGDIDRLDEKNPRRIADFMRRFSQATGMRFGEKMEDALRRLERGEDPDAVEADMGEDTAEEDDLFGFVRDSKARARRGRPPERDENIYDM